MTKVILEEDSWIRWIDKKGNGTIRVGQVKRRIKDKPFDSQNITVATPNYGETQLDVSTIIEVFPKITIRFNPSER